MLSVVKRICKSTIVNSNLFFDWETRNDPLLVKNKKIPCHSQTTRKQLGFPEQTTF